MILIDWPSVNDMSKQEVSHLSPRIEIGNKLSLATYLVDNEMITC